MSKERAFIVAISVLIVITVAACIVNIPLTEAYFSDTESGTVHITAGEWEPQPHICCICPDWGPCCACCWAVFIHGDDFGQLESVQLIRNGQVIEAKKAWLICDSLIYAVFDLRGSTSGCYDIIVKADNGEAVLEDGFRIVGLCCRTPLAYRDDSGTEDKLSLTKRIEEGGTPRLVITVGGDVPQDVSSACLVAPGYIQEGEIRAKEDRQVTLAFDTATIPASDCDLVLTTAEGWHVLLERAVTSKDLAPPAVIVSVEPAFSPPLDDVSIRIACENMPAEIDFRLRKDGCEIQACSVDMVDSRHALCRFDLSGKPAGVYDLMAMDAYGRTSLLNACFTLYAETDGTQGEQEGKEEQAIPPDTESPSIKEEPEGITPDESFKIVPEKGRSGTVIEIIVHGGPFTSHMQARLHSQKAMAWSMECTLSTSSWMDCIFNLNGVPPGKYVLEVLDLEGSLIYVAGIFEVI